MADISGYLLTEDFQNWIGLGQVKKNTIKAGGSTARAQNVDWMDGWMDEWYLLDCYDY